MATVTTAVSYADLYYLAYGSNLVTARLSARVGSVRKIAAVTLDGWTLRFHKRSRDGSGKANIVPCAHDQVFACVFAMSAAAADALDVIEGVGAGYRRGAITVADIGSCFVYLAEDDWVDEALRPYDWYHTLVVSGAREHGADTAYIERLHGWPATPDPDGERRERNLAALDNT